MKKEYFRTSINNEHFYGVVENIPEDVTIEEIKNRIQTSNGKEWLEITDEIYENPELIIDWETIDYEMGIDNDMISVLNVLEKSIDMDISSEVVYTSLKYMKENPSASISDAISYGLSKHIK